MSKKKKSNPHLSSTLDAFLEEEGLRSEFEARVVKLRADIQAGIDSGAATPLAMAEVRAEGQRLRAERRAAKGSA